MSTVGVTHSCKPVTESCLCHTDLLQMTETNVHQPLPYIWADVSTRVTVNLTLTNAFPGDMQPCASPCQGVTVFAAVSNDDVWGHAVDVTVGEYSLSSGRSCWYLTVTLRISTSHIKQLVIVCRW